MRYRGGNRDLQGEREVTRELNVCNARGGYSRIERRNGFGKTAVANSVLGGRFLRRQYVRRPVLDIIPCLAFRDLSFSHSFWT